MIVLGGNLSQVLAQSLSLLTPNGGEKWEANSKHTILWQSNNITKVKIEYSLSGGMGWHTVVPSVDASLGIYHWNVPDVQIAEVLIRISDASNPFVYDISDNKFRILKETEINKPQEVNKATQTSTPIKIMPLGDSITYGDGDDTKQVGYRSKLFDLLEEAGYDFDFVGNQSSGTSYTGNSNFDQDHEGHGGYEAMPPHANGKGNIGENLWRAGDMWFNTVQPDIIFLHIGTNDLNHGKPANTIANDINSLLDTIFQFDSNIVTFLAKIIHNEHNSETGLNNAIQTMYDALPSNQKAKVKIVNMHSEPELVYLGPADPNDDFSEATGSNTYNDLHPKKKGYDKMADKWFDAMQNYYQPVLASPDSNAVDWAIDDTLKWNAPLAADGSTIYGLQISTNINFTDIVFESSNINDTSMVLTGLKYGTKYFWRVRIPGYGWSPVWNFTTESMLASLKIFLQGPYAGSSNMSTTLNSKGLIPISQPYNSSPWNYTGTENVDSIPQQVVDWILVELRKTDTTIIKTRAAFLKSDGSITDLDGTSAVSFYDILPYNYYITIKHRNHLSVISAVPVLPINNTLTYDFTTDSSQFYGDGFAAMELETGSPGVWGMMASDGNSDGLINVLDLNLAWRPENGFDEYLKGDYNLDGYVNAVDKNLFWRSNNGLDSQVK